MPSTRSSSWMWTAIPSLRAAAAAMRTRFDCTAPVTSTVSAPLARASPKWNSSWRTLLPPKASPVQSSRLIRRSMPSAAPRFGAGSSGVGAWPSRTRGKRAMPARGLGMTGGGPGSSGLSIGSSVSRCAGRGAVQCQGLQADFAVGRDSALSVPGIAGAVGPPIGAAPQAARVGRPRNCAGNARTDLAAPLSAAPPRTSSGAVPGRPGYPVRISAARLSEMRIAPSRTQSRSRCA